MKGHLDRATRTIATGTKSTVRVRGLGTRVERLTEKGTRSLVRLNRDVCSEFRGKRRLSRTSGKLYRTVTDHGRDVRRCRGGVRKLGNTYRYAQYNGVITGSVTFYPCYKSPMARRRSVFRTSSLTRRMERRTRRTRRDIARTTRTTIRTIARTTRRTISTMRRSIGRRARR